ncbi:MAG TPA: hypothetical protein VKB84_06600 [Candidatus Binataceae bacterium]|nr:hypothetical protein [Candidatus Binataceae bacterium]
MATLLGFFWRLTAAGIVALALVALCSYGAYAQSADSTDSVTSNGGDADSQPAGTAAATAPADSSPSTDAGAAAKSDSPSNGAYEMHAALKSFDTPPRTGDSAFDHAAELFPSFCKDWQRRLHDRELNNLENITWKDQNGWKTGTYLAYSPIKTCNCKHSTGGVPIGELTYQETEYYLTGRTVEEARHAAPKPVGITNTTEIFRWDRTKWDDGR